MTRHSAKVVVMKGMKTPGRSAKTCGERDLALPLDPLVLARQVRSDNRLDERDTLTRTLDRPGRFETIGHATSLAPAPDAPPAWRASAATHMLTSV
jgi:hypothetical protein